MAWKIWDGTYLNGLYICEVADHKIYHASIIPGVTVIFSSKANNPLFEMSTAVELNCEYPSKWVCHCKKSKISHGQSTLEFHWLAGNLKK